MKRNPQPSPESPTNNPPPPAGAGSSAPADLEGLAGQAEQLDAGGAPGAREGEFIPRGEQEQEQKEKPKGPPLDVMIARILGVTFKIAAPNWNVSDPECAMLGTAYCDVLNKYFPDGIAIGPELGAIFATAVVFGPRLNIPPRPPKAEPEQEPAAA